MTRDTFFFVISITKLLQINLDTGLNNHFGSKYVAPKEEEDVFSKGLVEPKVEEEVGYSLFRIIWKKTFLFRTHTHSTASIRASQPRTTFNRIRKARHITPFFTQMKFVPQDSFPIIMFSLKDVKVEDYNYRDDVKMEEVEAPIDPMPNYYNPSVSW